MIARGDDNGLLLVLTTGEIELLGESRKIAFPTWMDGAYVQTTLETIADAGIYLSTEVDRHSMVRLALGPDAYGELSTAGFVGARGEDYMAILVAEQAYENLTGTTPQAPFVPVTPIYGL